MTATRSRREPCPIPIMPIVPSTTPLSCKSTIRQASGMPAKMWLIWFPVAVGHHDPLFGHVGQRGPSDDREGPRDELGLIAVVLRGPSKRDRVRQLDHLARAVAGDVDHARANPRVDLGDPRGWRAGLERDQREAGDRARGGKADVERGPVELADRTKAGAWPKRGGRLERDVGRGIEVDASGRVLVGTDPPRDASLGLEHEITGREYQRQGLGFAEMHGSCRLHEHDSLNPPNRRFELQDEGWPNVREYGQWKRLGHDRVPHDPIFGHYLDVDPAGGELDLRVSVEIRPIGGLHGAPDLKGSFRSVR